MMKNDNEFLLKNHTLFQCDNCRRVYWYNNHYTLTNCADDIKMKCRKCNSFQVFPVNRVPDNDQTHP